ncbi:hypothetical protein RYX36_026528 [Vicia faba]
MLALCCYCMCADVVETEQIRCGWCLAVKSVIFEWYGCGELVRWDFEMVLMSSVVDARVLKLMMNKIAVGLRNGRRLFEGKNISSHAIRPSKPAPSRSGSSFPSRLQESALSLSLRSVVFPWTLILIPINIQEAAVELSWKNTSYDLRTMFDEVSMKMKAVNGFREKIE